MVDESLQKIWDKFDEDIAKRPYWLRAIIAFDQFFNVLLMNGSQDQTISGHIAKKQYEGTNKWYHDLICKGLRKLEAKHCWLSRAE